MYSRVLVEYIEDDLLLLIVVHVVTLAVQQPKQTVLSSPGPAGGRTASYAAGSLLANTRLSAH